METSSSVIFLMKWGCRGHWGHWGHWGCWGHWGRWGSWCQKITLCVNCKLSFSAKSHKKAKNVEKKNLKTALHQLHSNSYLQNFFLLVYISSCRRRRVIISKKLVVVPKMSAFQDFKTTLKQHLACILLSVRANWNINLCPWTPCSPPVLKL